MNLQFALSNAMGCLTQSTKFLSRRERRDALAT